MKPILAQVIAVVVFMALLFDWSITCNTCGREHHGILNILKRYFRECDRCKERKR